MYLEEGFIVCSNEFKHNLLKEKNDVFINYIYLTEEELLEKLTFKVDPKAILFLVDKYNFSYSLAKEYIANLKWINDVNYNNPKLDSMVSVLKALKNEGLIIENKLFPIRLKQFPVTFIYPNLSKEYYILKSMVEKYTKVNEVLLPIGDKNNLTDNCLKAFEFNTINEEVLFVFNKITDLLKSGVSLNNIYITGVNDNYLFLFNRLAKNYSITLEFPADKNISSSNIVKQFLLLCKEKTSFNEILEMLDKEDLLYDIIFNTIDRYDLNGKVPSEYIEFLNYIFNHTNYPVCKYSEAIRFVDNSFVLKENEYLFYVGFNLGEAPKIVKETGFLLDKELDILGLSNTLDKNIRKKDELMGFIYQNNVTLTYKNTMGTDTFLPSQLINILGIEVVKPNVEYGYSKIEDDLRLARFYDNYVKYNEINSDLSKYGIGDIQYNSFNNKYKPINNEILKERFIKKPLKLSYSNVKPYFACPFSYFADRILGLNEFKPQMAARLGTFSHAVLEDSYDEGFDFEDSVKRNIISHAVDSKDRFFFERMKDILRPLINFNKEHEALSKLNFIQREANIVVLNEGYQFEGFIDKLMYTVIDNDVYAAIIDYKTGKDVISLDNIEDGFHLQLPAYMYLLSKYEKFKGKNLHIIGIYLQKVNLVIFDGKKDYSEQLEKSFYLQGYSVQDTNLLSMLDPTFSSSSYIKSMSLTTNGFSRYAKLYEKEDKDKMIELVQELLDKASFGIKNGDYRIAPKRIDGKNESCLFCKYKDLCFLEEKDVIDLPKKPFKERG